MANGEQSWFSDGEDLLRGVRDTASHWADLPEISGYAELVELERGGQGVVYQARQCSTNQLVAIKVLRSGASATDEDRFRFCREIELVAALDHSSIVRVHDSGITPQGQPFYVMELVDGLPVDEACEQAGMDLAGRLALFAAICDAVGHAHWHGIIHRDLKPRNILVDGDGHPHILDFGLAKLTSDRTGAGAAALDSVTRSGQFLGSLAWASPEQVERTPEQVGLGTDVYSLGAILYQLLTGQLPHGVTTNLVEAVRGITVAPPVPPRSIRPQIPTDVETIVLRCLAKEPGRRYPSVGELQRDVRRYLAGEPIGAKRDHTGYLLRRAIVRHKIVAGLAALLLLSGVVFLVAITAQYRRVVDAERSASHSLEVATIEAERAEVVRRFLTRMLSAVNPSRAGRDVRVVELLEQAAIDIDVGFDDKPIVEAALRHCIGQAYRSLGLLKQASQHLERGLSLSVEHRGVEHREAIQASMELAILRAMQGRLPEAESLFEGAQQVVERCVDETDELFAATLLGVAGLRNMQGRLIESEQLLRRGLALAAEHRGETHPDTIRATHNLAAVLNRMQRRDESEVFLRRALAQHTEVHGPEHLHTVRARGNLGVLLMESGRLDEAEPLVVATLAAVRKILGEDHAETINFLHNVAVLREYRGEHDRALTLARQALQAAEKVMTSGHLKIARYRSHVGACLERLGRYQQAEQELLAADRDLRTQLGDGHPYAQKSATELARLYESWGKPELSSRWRELAPGASGR